MSTDPTTRLGEHNLTVLKGVCSQLPPLALLKGGNHTYLPPPLPPAPRERVEVSPDRDPDYVSGGYCPHPYCGSERGLYPYHPWRKGRHLASTAPIPRRVWGVRWGRIASTFLLPSQADSILHCGGLLLEGPVRWQKGMEEPGE